MPIDTLESPFLHEALVPRASIDELEENEFLVNRLPAKARLQFAKGKVAWREAVAEAIQAGLVNAKELANVIFFMHHPELVKTGIGPRLKRTDKNFVKLSAEWNLHRMIAGGLLEPAAVKSVFLPHNLETRYEHYLKAPTTGRITFMINGKTAGGARPRENETGAFDSMQQAVESLGRGDSIYLSTWQFKPSAVALTVKSAAGHANWGDLLVDKANQGVTIRIIMSDMPPDAEGFKSDVNDVKKLVGRLPVAAQNNLKYIVSMHPATLPDPRKFLAPTFVATHHQKFMIVRKGTNTIAFCGGLDISPPRTPPFWVDFIWHDIHARLEGLIVRDLEREFVLRWNREKDKSTAAKLTQWKTLEALAESPADRFDRRAESNPERMQMQRTVATGAVSTDIKRDDVWQGYFRLIGAASRFLFLENQYFHEPSLADAIVTQAQAQPALIVMIVVSAETDDPANPLSDHGRFLQHTFFTRLLSGVPASRVRVYTMRKRLVHSKLILADDRALSIGSANANPRGFFMDTELNVVVDGPAAVRGFRHELWSHDLGVPVAEVRGWGIADFIPRWDKAAQANAALSKTPDKMVGESVIPFDPLAIAGTESPIIPDVLTEM